MYPIRPVPEEIVSELKVLCEKKGLNFLYEELKEKDPEQAHKIGPKDRYRILRSLAIIRSEGRLVSRIKKEFSAKKLPWPCLKIGLEIPREELLKRVEHRTQTMLKEGLIEEIEQLLKKGFEHWKPLQSVGYREGVLFLKGKLNKEELYTQIVQNTLTLAKKQKKWFRQDKDIFWYDFKANPLDVYEKIVEAKSLG